MVYGFVTSRWLLSLSPGNDEMQKISLAVQQGATAYLRRQYTIIGGVAVVMAIVLAIALEAQGSEGVLIAIGFLIGGTFSGAAGFIGKPVFMFCAVAIPRLWKMRSSPRVADGLRPTWLKNAASE